MAICTDPLHINNRSKVEEQRTVYKFYVVGDDKEEVERTVEVLLSYNSNSTNMTISQEHQYDNITRAPI